MPHRLPYPEAMMAADTDRPMQYEIRVEGQLDAAWQAWFDDLFITTTDDGNMTLCGLVADQAALYGILRRINKLGLRLISVNPQLGKQHQTQGPKA